MREKDLIGRRVRRVADGPDGSVGVVEAFVDDADETGRDALVWFAGEPLTEYSPWALTLVVGEAGR